MKKFTELSLAQRISTGALLLIVVVLSYGYWRVISYGWFYISLYEVTEKGKRYHTIKDANIKLLDKSGKLLAEGGSLLSFT